MSDNNRDRQLQDLYSLWANCTKCSLHQHRRQVVCGLGDVHPLIMFIGEGPGKAEDLLGKPFIGPSGRLLRHAIYDSLDLDKRPTRHRPEFYFTNVVACRPTESRAAPNRAPTKEEAWACMPRLARLDEILQPPVVVLLGVVPSRLAGYLFPSAGRLPHPSAILRAGGVESGSYPGYVRDLAAQIERAEQIEKERRCEKTPGV